MLSYRICRTFKVFLLKDIEKIYTGSRNKLSSYLRAGSKINLFLLHVVCSLELAVESAKILVFFMGLIKLKIV